MNKEIRPSEIVLVTHSKTKEKSYRRMALSMIRKEIWPPMVVLFTHNGIFSEGSNFMGKRFTCMGRWILESFEVWC